MKDATGPALSNDLLLRRSDEWITTMITDQRHLKRDSTRSALVKSYGGLRCPEQKISERHLAMPLRYLRGAP